MNKPVLLEPEPARKLIAAIGRGLRGRCPRCGQGRLFHRYISPLPECTVCGEDLAAYQTADFAPYLVTFFIGLVFTPITVALSLSAYASDWLIALLMVTALMCALLLLPRAKGAALALLWALDVQANQ